MWARQAVLLGRNDSHHFSVLRSVAAFLTRSITTREEGANATWQACQGGGLRPRVVPFQLSQEQAQSAFDQWHEQFYLSPTRLLAGAQPMRSVLLPFWLFEASVHVEYAGMLGFPINDKSMDWREAQWRDRGYREYPWTLSAMQVYASYKHRRDLVEVLKVPGMLGRSRPLKHYEAARQKAAVGKGWPEEVDMDPPEMRQSIAWQFALSNMRAREAVEVEHELKAQTGCEAVKDIQIRLRTLRRRARLLFLPAYVVDYAYGESFNEHGLRLPVRFQAIIGGLSGSSVAAERHYSPQKVQVAAAAAMSAAGMLAGAVGLMGADAPALLSAPALLWVVMVCTTAGLAARLSPLLLRQSAEARRIEAEEADMEKILAQGLGPHDLLDSKHEVRLLAVDLRSQAEWRRWEEADKWSWDGAKRRRWAEALWRRQHMRKLQKAAFQVNRERAEARVKAEEEAEARRRARWGHSSHHARFTTGDSNTFSGGTSGGGQKDFLGYYGLLGLDRDLGSTITVSEIKRAFREAALRWHPDRLRVDDEMERQRAHERFQKVKKAYEVLRNPQKRRDYDSGVQDLS